MWEVINTPFSGKFYPILDQDCPISTPYCRQTCLKTTPLTATHNTYMGVTPPLPHPPSPGQNPTFGLMAACDELKRIKSLSGNKFQQI